MADITYSVGRNGANNDADVAVVQTLLDQAPVSEGGPSQALDIDGWCGTRTNKAIWAFQAKQFGWADGRVDPDGKTIARLNEVANCWNARPVGTEDWGPAEQARWDAPLALAWAQVGLGAATRLLSYLDDGGDIDNAEDYLLIALEGHFKLTPTLAAATLRSHLNVIQRNFTFAMLVLGQAMLGGFFQSVSRRQMVSDLRGGEAPGYTNISKPGKPICWTPLFHVLRFDSRPGLEWTGRGFGPLCRTAMVLHEPIHHVDPLANFDVYEWGQAYLTLPAARAVHNASSYPSFAAHVLEKSTDPLGPRYGIGRPLD